MMLASACCCCCCRGHWPNSCAVQARQVPRCAQDAHDVAAGASAVCGPPTGAAGHHCPAAQGCAADTVTTRKQCPADMRARQCLSRLDSHLQVWAVSTIERTSFMSQLLLVLATCQAWPGFASKPPVLQIALAGTCLTAYAAAAAAAPRITAASITGLSRVPAGDLTQE